jgi:hypothetical protein
MRRTVRLNENDLSRIVRRVINENQEAQKQQLEAKITSCFNKNKYPHLYRLMVAKGQGMVAMGAAALTVLGVASGVGAVGAGLTGTAALMIGKSAVDNYVKAFKSDKTGNLMSEAKSFAKCITGY